MSKTFWIGLVVIVGILLVMSLITFCMYATDKKRAREGAWRIKERTLIGMAFVGGGLGALLGMKLLRHKTQHTNFKILVPLGLVVNLLVAAAILFLLTRVK